MAFSHTTSTKKARTRPARRHGDTLDPYFDGLGKFDLLTPDQEREMASGIEDIELALWTALLSHPKASGPLGRRLRAALEKQSGGPLESMEPAAVRSSDPDRVLLEAALTEVNRYADEHRTAPGVAAWRSRVIALDRAAMQSRQRFAEANLRLVVKVAREYDYGRMPLPDLIQEGNVGLLQAIGRFDAERGTRFATYAVWWIRHAVRRALVNKGRSVRVPNHVAGAGYRVVAAIESMTHKLGRQPNNAEIANACDMTEAKVEQVQLALMQTDVPFDTPHSGRDEAQSLAETLPYEDEGGITVVDMLASSRALEKVLHLLPSLSDIEVDVVKRRFGLFGSERQTLVEIGRAHSLSRERIRQLQRQALDKLRRGIESRAFALP